MTSRETSDARIPGVPCVWLSETAIVLNTSGTPPASSTAADTPSARRRWLRLQGIVPVHVDAMPTIGPSRRSGSMPIARKCDRAAARSAPARRSARRRRVVEPSSMPGVRPRAARSASIASYSRRSSSVDGSSPKIAPSMFEPILKQTQAHSSTICASVNSSRSVSNVAAPIERWSSAASSAKAIASDSWMSAGSVGATRRRRSSGSRVRASARRTFSFSDTGERRSRAQQRVVERVPGRADLRPVVEDLRRRACFHSCGRGCGAWRPLALGDSRVYQACFSRLRVRTSALTAPRAIPPAAGVRRSSPDAHTSIAIRPGA